jgi:hypothetical protein
MNDVTPAGKRPPGLRLHKRTMKVQSAEAEFRTMVLAFEHDKGLTITEMAQILTTCLQRQLTALMRCERHPDDPTRKADEQ